MRAILWDNDGVLVDSERIFFDVNREYFARHAVDLSEQNFFDWFLVQDLGAWHLLADRGYSAADIAHCRAERNALYSERLAASPPLANPGVEDVLRAFHRTIPMAVVTSSSPEHFAAIHDRTGLARYFDFVLTADTYAKAKPAPDPYLKAIEVLAIRAEHCIAVEDSPRGLAAARAAAVDCVVLRTSLTRGFAFEDALRVVDSVAELADVLRELAARP